MNFASRLLVAQLSIRRRSIQSLPRFDQISNLFEMNFEVVSWALLICCPREYLEDSRFRCSMDSRRHQHAHDYLLFANLDDYFTISASAKLGFLHLIGNRWSHTCALTSSFRPLLIRFSKIWLFQ